MSIDEIIKKLAVIKLNVETGMYEKQPQYVDVDFDQIKDSLEEFKSLVEDSRTKKRIADGTTTRREHRV